MTDVVTLYDGYLLTMEDDDDEEDFETLVYSQCETNQDAA